jgi:sec-independent protein translocase protein TatA
VAFPLAVNVGPWEIILVLAVLLLLFGANKLPKLARSLGASMTEFKKGLRGESEEDKKKIKPEGEDAESKTGQRAE